MTFPQYEHIDLLRQHVERGNVTTASQQHGDVVLTIYNYAPSVQYGRLWDVVTQDCRGLILDQEYRVHARPFRKFFNLEEHGSHEIPQSGFRTYPKFDGSLGIFYCAGPGQYRIATRGSFNSEQAIEATKMLNESPELMKYHAAGWGQGWTPLFEIIYPENRIVVDYGDMRTLIHLGDIHRETGQYRESADITFRRDTSDMTPQELKALNTRNAEGFVLYWPDHNFRVKVKFDEYVELHRKVFGLSTTSVWEAWAAGGDLEDFLAEIPDEFHDWAQDQWRDLNSAASNILFDVTSNHKVSNPAWTRKEYAEFANTTRYPKLMFMVQDNKDILPVIRRMIKPRYEKATRTA